MVVPGNIYMLSENQWILVDTYKICNPKTHYTDHLERAAEAISVAITKLPIGDKCLKLEHQESKILQALSYDISSEIPISWLIPADIYYLGHNKMVAVTGTNITAEYSSLPDKTHNWNPRTQLVRTVPNPNPITSKPKTPKLVVSPAVIPSTLKTPLCETKGKPKLVQPYTGPVNVEMNVV
jgi:hypothetical protein